MPKPLRRTCLRCQGTSDLIVIRGKEYPATPSNLTKYQSKMGGGSLAECPDCNLGRINPPPSITKLPRRSLWQGPAVDGITFSLLSKFLVCRERFRLKVVDGWREELTFDRAKAMEYGSLWHEAEEAHAANKDWAKPMGRYRDRLRSIYPEAEAGILHWFNIAKVQFPAYIDHWRNHATARGRTPIFEEVAFRVPYTLPSGRSLILRGKFDCVFLWKRGKAKPAVFLQENKTKGEIDEEGIQRTVDQNLQTMLYHIALRTMRAKQPEQCPAPLLKNDIAGTLYNVVRRPLSDRYAIRQRKTETASAFYKRLGSEIRKKMDHYFMRWEALIYEQDVDRFRREVLDPILEGLLDWWDSIAANPFDPWTDHRTGKPNPHHFRKPYGVYDSIFGGFRGDYFDLLTKGVTTGLIRTDNLFPELT